MNLLEQLAEAALLRDSLSVRSLVQDMLRSGVVLAEIERPATQDARLLGIAASFAELLAERHNQQPPAWTKEIGPLPEPYFLLRHAETMKRLRLLCQTQSPEPLRRRRLYAPPHYLDYV